MTQLLYSDPRKITFTIIIPIIYQTSADLPTLGPLRIIWTSPYIFLLFSWKIYGILSNFPSKIREYFKQHSRLVSGCFYQKSVLQKKWLTIPVFCSQVRSDASSFSRRIWWTFITSKFIYINNRGRETVSIVKYFYCLVCGCLVCGCRTYSARVPCTNKDSLIVPHTKSASPKRKNLAPLLT